MNALLKDAMWVLPVVVFTFLALDRAQAEGDTANVMAEMTLVNQVVIHEDRNLDFGVIVKPTSGSKDFRVQAGNGAMTVTGSGSGGAALGGHHTGQYDITGTVGEVVLMTTRIGQCTTPKIQLRATSFASSPNVTLNVNDLQLGGTLRVMFDAPAGAHTCPYQVSAQY